MRTGRSVGNTRAVGVSTCLGGALGGPPGGAGRARSRPGTLPGPSRAWSPYAGSPHLRVPLLDRSRSEPSVVGRPPGFPGDRLRTSGRRREDRGGNSRRADAPEAKVPRFAPSPNSPSGGRGFEPRTVHHHSTETGDHGEAIQLTSWKCRPRRHIHQASRANSPTGPPHLINRSDGLAAMIRAASLRRGLVAQARGRGRGRAREENR